MFVILAFLVLMVIAPLISPHVPGPMRKWALMISSLVCLSPFFLWEVLFPPAIELTAYSETVDYEFRDETYAVEFGLLNQVDRDREASDGSRKQVDENAVPHITA